MTQGDLHRTSSQRSATMVRKKWGHRVWIAISAAGILSLTVAIIGMLLLMGYILESGTSSFRRALPAGATDMHDRLVDMAPDHIYVLQAKLSRVEFDGYVRRLGLTLHNPSRIYTDDSMWLSWRTPMVSEVWWHPSGEITDTYVRQDGHTWVFAKFEGDRLHLQSISH